MTKEEILQKISVILGLNRTITETELEETIRLVEGMKEKKPALAEK